MGIEMGNDDRITETDHWSVVADERYPDDRKKDVWKEKPDGGGYQTPAKPSPVGDMPSLAAWIKDMREWGLMMHEAVLELRERVEKLEAAREAP